MKEFILGNSLKTKNHFYGTEQKHAAIGWSNESEAAQAKESPEPDQKAVKKSKPQVMALVSYAESISELAQAGAKIAKEKGIDCGKMCDTCAFKWNQEHNLTYFLAADQAAEQLIWEGQFNCHTHDFKCADKPCAGFKFAKLVFEKDLVGACNKLKNK